MEKGQVGPSGQGLFLLECPALRQNTSAGIITDAYAMRKLYLDEFKTPSACIAYGGNIERSAARRSFANMGWNRATII